MNISFKLFRTLYSAFLHAPPRSSSNNQSAATRPAENHDTASGFAEMQAKVLKVFAMQPSGESFAREIRCRMRDSTEAFMSTTVALGRKQDDSGVPGQGVNSPLGCAPDYISYAMLMGPAFATKMHVLTTIHSKTRLRGGDMVRSLVDRIGRLFRDAAVVPQTWSIGVESA